MLWRRQTGQHKIVLQDRFLQNIFEEQDDHSPLLYSCIFFKRNWDQGRSSNFNNCLVVKHLHCSRVNPKRLQQTHSRKDSSSVWLKWKAASRKFGGSSHCRACTLDSIQYELLLLWFCLGSERALVQAAIWSFLLFMESNIGIPELRHHYPIVSWWVKLKLKWILRQNQIGLKSKNPHQIPPFLNLFSPKIPVYCNMVFPKTFINTHQYCVNMIML